jgi:hypothetical protein
MFTQNDEGYLLHLIFILLTLTGCGSHSNHSSSLKLRPKSRDAPNVFVVAGAANGLSGVQTDVRELSKLLLSSEDELAWNVKSNFDVGRDDLIALVSRSSLEVGESGTLALYLSGHGNSSGGFITTSGVVTLSEIVHAVVAKRVTPLSRFMVFVDSCYSGYWVDQSQLGEGSKSSFVRPAEDFFDPDPEEAKVANENLLRLLAEAVENANKSSSRVSVNEVVAMSASKKDELALDLGQDQGGAFTYALRKSYTLLQYENQEATLGNFFEMVQKETYRLTRHHTPSYLVRPDRVLTEKLFKFDTDKHQADSR